MSISTTFKGGLAVLAASAAAILPGVAAAQSAPASESGKWQYSAFVYGYFPDIGGKLSAPVSTSGSNLNVDASTIIDGLKMAFMGSFDAHNGRWGFFTDLLYMNVGDDKSQTRDFSLGGVLPASATADLSLDLKGVAWTLAGEYRVVSDPAWTADVLLGARMFGVKPTLGWSFSGDVDSIGVAGRSGSKEIDDTVWDAIVGIKGGYRFGDKREWFVPYYLDVGTGQSDLTWQAAGGIGYSFHWGDVIAMWRYLDYNFKSGKELQEMNFNGPMVGVAFRW
jgi:hypothetical protein